MRASAELLQLLACPWCLHNGTAASPAAGARGELEWVGPEEQVTGLRCRDCRRLYKVEQDIPNLLAEEAVVEDTGGQGG